MSKKAVIIVVVLILVVAASCAVIAYNVAITRATTAEGWVDFDENEDMIFVLEVDGNYYVWDISEG